ASDRTAFRWQSSGPDLLSSDGTFIRGFEDSIAVAIASGKENTVYPGFLRASAKVTNFDHWHLEHPYPFYPYSAEFRKLAKLEELPGGTMAATYCLWLRNGHDAGIVHLEYRREGAAPPSKQQGPRDNPSANIFGDWYATKRNLIANSDPDAQPCQSIPSEFSEQFNNTEDLSSVPGWPR
ncbi:hypothetical protein ACW9HQ_45335, partial [Nocardia gipuzkoensis]